MSIELAIYLMGVVSALDVFCFFSAIVLVSSALLIFINANGPFSDEKERAKINKICTAFMSIAVILVFLSCFIPSKATMEKIFAIRIAKSEVVTEAAGKVIKLIGKYLPGEAND